MTGPEHHIEDSGWIKKSSLIERAKVRPPCYGYLPKVRNLPVPSPPSTTPTNP
jgi:hypothetical protein